MEKDLMKGKPVQLGCIIFIVALAGLNGYYALSEKGNLPRQPELFGAARLTVTNELMPGIYEYQNVWFTGFSYIAPVRLVTVTSKNAAKRYLEFVPSSDQWMVLDLGPQTPIPGRNSTNQPFTGLFEVWAIHHDKVIQVYLPFRDTSSNSTNSTNR
jgi:hypothetical protein